MAEELQGVKQVDCRQAITCNTPCLIKPCADRVDMILRSVDGL